MMTKQTHCLKDWPSFGPMAHDGSDAAKAEPAAPIQTTTLSSEHSQALVSRLIEITQLDPQQRGLHFERFLGERFERSWSRATECLSAGWFVRELNLKGS